MRAITEELKKAIIATSINWLDVVCGVIEPIKVNIQAGESVKSLTIPAYRQPRQMGCKKGNDYTECVPNTEFKSLIYIEAENPSNKIHTTRYEELEMRCKIVCWLNLNEINTIYDNADDLANELLNSLPSMLPNIAPYHSIRLDIDALHRDIGDVNKYDYNEEENQYWIYPFDFFIIDTTITYRRNKNCNNDTSISSRDCKIY